nr:heparan sulfate 2-O-sulfotransferase 1-like [Lytechinus pictus]
MSTIPKIKANNMYKQLRDALDNGHMRHLQKVPTPLVADELFQQRPMYPLIIYNRVPKTGSTSLTSLPYTLCETLRYHVLHICTVEHTQVLSVQDQIGIVRNISSWSVKQPGFFHGHFAYLDFPRFGSQINPIYINMVRSPLDRFISYYYFLRHGDNFRPSLSRHRARSNETLDECVLRQGFDCAPERMWIQVPFFCGHNPECWKPGSRWALEQAKYNVVNKYFLVGVTEHMEEFVALLEASLPSFFKGALHLFKKGEKSHLRKTIQKIDPLPYTMDTLKNSEVWKIEDKFYRFVLETFRTNVARSLVIDKDQSVRVVKQQYSFEKIRPNRAWKRSSNG